MSELLSINVNSHTEKKNNLTYLSWAWAWAEVLKIDPLSTWDAVEFNGLPCVFLPDTSAMVKTIVTIKGNQKSCWLPVMNHRNQAIKNPDAFAINTAMVRCLTKTIGMHGLGLYIYAGEDMPESFEYDGVPSPVTGFDAVDWCNKASGCQDVEELKLLWKAAGAEAAKAKDRGGYALVKNAVAEKLASFEAEKVEVKE